VGPPTRPDVEASELGDVRFRTIFDHVPTGIAITDLEGRFIHCNPAYCAMVGYDLDELRAIEFGSLVHPNDREENLDLVEKMIAGEIPFVEIENRTVRSDGDIVWMHKYVSMLPPSADAPARLVALVSDVSARRRLSELLADSEQRFRTVFESAAAGIIEVDTDGRFQRVNDAFAAIVGRRPEELVGLRFADISHPEDLDEDLTKLAQLTAGTIDSYSVRKRYLRPDDSFVWVNLQASAVRDPEGRPHHYVGIVEDITAQVAEEAAADYRRLTAELRADVLSELERGHADVAQLERLVELLVPRFADYATVDVRTGGPRAVAVAHRDPDLVEHVRTVRADPALLFAYYHQTGRPAYGEGLLLADAAPVIGSLTGLRPATRASLQQLGPRSIIAVPITLDLADKEEAVLTMVRSDPTRSPFTEEDQAFAEDLASRAGVVLAGVALREREHRVSLHFQQALLPGKLTTVPGIEVSGRYAPALEGLEVGGDWYDSLPLGDGRLLVVVGDVLGHGMEAAAIMGRLRSGLGALAAREPGPGALLTALDQFASGPHGADFATVCCAVVEPSTGQVTWSSAGHPPLLVVEPGGATRWLSDAVAPPLCTGHTGTRPEARTHLEPGSLLVLYSDGLVERRGSAIGVGLDRLASTAAAVHDEPLDLVAERIIDDMTDHGAPADDVVVLALRLVGTTAFTFELQADASELASLRVAMRDWLTAQGVTGTGADTALLVVGEACSNGIDHAFLQVTPGVITVTMRLTPGHLDIEVTDVGAWRRPGPHMDGRGRGTLIMRELSVDFRRIAGPAGTTVMMRLPLETRRRD
jgi:PAS domain S-box-containing protein